MTFVKVTERVRFASPGDTEEGWISSSWVYALQVLKYLEEGDQHKIRMISDKAMLEQSEHMDLKDSHR